MSKIPVVIGRVRSILNREKGSYEIRERVVKLIAVDDCLGTKSVQKAGEVHRELQSPNSICGSSVLSRMFQSDIIALI